MPFHLLTGYQKVGCLLSYNYKFARTSILFLIHWHPPCTSFVSFIVSKSWCTGRELQPSYGPNRRFNVALRLSFFIYSVLTYSSSISLSCSYDYLTSFGCASSSCWSLANICWLCTEKGLPLIEKELAFCISLYCICNYDMYCIWHTFRVFVRPISLCNVYPKWYYLPLANLDALSAILVFMYTGGGNSLR